ncbi:MAG: BtpA/SgcQ family protein [Erysipelotrichaceae bacterium]
MSKNWIKEVFNTNKAIIGLVHMQPLPGDPYYDVEGGMEKVIEMAKKDVIALQNGGADGLLFSNEFSTPYLSKVGVETVASMAYVIGALKSVITLPYGNDCISDDMASIALASATGAIFTRGVFHGTWATSNGFCDSSGGSAVRLKHKLSIPDFKLVHYLIPESSADVGGRDAISIMKPTYFLNEPDGMAIAGMVAGQKADVSVMKKCRDAFPDATIFAATGVKIDNVQDYLGVVDGIFIGTSFKKDGLFKNGIDESRVKEFMDKVKSLRND